MNLLLLHGFTPHPVLTLDPLPQVLREVGFSVSPPAFFGHGTRLEDLLKVRRQDRRGMVQEAYRKLPEHRGTAGLPRGALLSAHLTAETPAQVLAVWGQLIANNTHLH
ncbi:hypothetical protein [Thermus antranikianii]|uniref:hypothetical protein n=1 Tax=Thermus antranikianii TaxID=88190 RepID=UPI00041CB1CC|nr:MAG: hypothetical protein KNN15_03445 [Thermus antranikianii]